MPLGWLLCLSLAAVRQVDAHAMMIVPEPRDGADNAEMDGLDKVNGPCGPDDQAIKGEVKVAFVAGDTVNVRWQADLPHGAVPWKLLR